ncbi:EAL domain-containing protein [Vibrio hippocampi]|uniref:Cyclic di-GMP phosphodiesterase PdeB n=1 Tax=Vibrio hippocampi TaxID=654686 RepID=A0ABM8ZNH8_9VIBR|nr:EAL domain-containing protein [Vibrio hippocampi]CAH0529539.1 putative cyclic di-GMP phosphodiesterase PdeB [Vibrio hippocampi]
MLLNDKQDFSRRIRIDEDGCYVGDYNDLTLKSVFQPLFSAQNKILGLEALVRLIDKDGVFVPPDRFFQDESISLADKLNVDRLSRVIHIRNFHMSEYRNRLLFLNFLPISSERLAAEGIENSLLMSRLKALQIDSTRIVVELVELTAFSPRTLARAARHLIESKFLVAIDDYGCKESNAERVAEVKPNIIKIDRQLLLDYMNGDQTSLLEGIKLARASDAKIVIEGIETAEQLSAMKQLDIDFFQGYYLARPEALLPEIKIAI